MRDLMKDMEAIVRCRRRSRSEYMAPYGLKACHAIYITELAEAPGISQEQLAARIYADKSSVARQLAVLEENGYVRRNTSEKDKRTSCVYLTERAETLLSVIRERDAAWEQELTEAMTEREKDALAVILRRLSLRLSEGAEKKE